MKISSITFITALPPPKQPYPLTSSLPNPTLTSRNPRTFASVANSHPNPNTKNFPPPLQQLPPIPKHSFINQFKLGQIIIRAKFGLPHPFPNLNAWDIAKKVNTVLDELNLEELPFSIKIRAVTKSPSGDIKFFTQNCLGAKWLLDNKYCWTHLSDPSFVTNPPPPVLCHCSLLSL